MPISYAPTSWNPMCGCDPVSEGCKNCWAMKLHNQRHEAYWRNLGSLPEQYAEPFSKIQLLPDRLSQPLRWRKPRTVAVCFMGDLFHEQVPDEFIARVFTTMGRVPKHRFLLLTKRPGRLAEIVRWLEAERERARDGGTSFYGLDIVGFPWPLPNVWLGVTAENQRMADERIPLLLKTPAAHRWASLEPLLGPVDLRLMSVEDGRGIPGRMGTPRCANLSWIVVGGESGPSYRDMNPAWVESLSAQCLAARLSYYGKQRAANRPGQPLPAHLGRRELPWAQDGRERAQQEGEA